MKLRKLFFGRKTRAEVWKMLADLTSTGMELARALELVGKTTGKRNSTVRHIMQDLRKSLASDRFKQVIRQYVPESESLIFSRFGNSPNEDLFRAAARIALVEAEISNAILSAIFRPVLLLALMIGLLYLLGSDFYPTLSVISPIESWPTLWQFVAAIAFWVADNPFMIFIYIVTIYIIYKVIQISYTGPARHILDRIPPFSLYRMKIGATFTFVILENAAVGNTINSNLMRILSKDSSRYIKSRIMAIEKHISAMNIGAAATKAGMNFPDPELNAVLEAYAEQQNWEKNFRTYAEAWLQRIEVKVKAAVSVLNIILMLVAGGVIVVVGQTIFGLVNMIN